jgi:DNA-binding Xre family transcriptional regulator
MTERIHRKLNRSPEDTARLKAVREKFQREKPTVEELVGDGPTTTMGELLLVHQIAHRFKEERRRLNLSLADLSERTGMDQAALSRLENGKQANPTLETLSRVAAALGKR